LWDDVEESKHNTNTPTEIKIYDHTGRLISLTSAERIHTNDADEITASSYTQVLYKEDGTTETTIWHDTYKYDCKHFLSFYY
ncbi:MAG TPA: hypothetical protein VL947_14370, partial [Cytophagales bacterium]|nr:hypothetical protein [Cytophagales bacterium]